MTVSETLQHAKARFECLAEEFDKAGDTASWAMCSTDAEMMGRALTAALSDQAVAPKEPTLEMIEAAEEFHANGIWYVDGASLFGGLYKAMIAAATPPSSTAGDG